MYSRAIQEKRSREEVDDEKTADKGGKKAKARKAKPELGPSRKVSAAKKGKAQAPPTVMEKSDNESIKEGREMSKKKGHAHMQTKTVSRLFYHMCYILLIFLPALEACLQRLETQMAGITHTVRESRQVFFAARKC